MARTSFGLFCVTVALGWCVGAAQAVLIDFNTWPDGSPTINGWPVDDEYAELGVVFGTRHLGSESNASIFAQGEYPLSLSNLLFSGSDRQEKLFMQFVVPVTEVEFLLNSVGPPPGEFTIELFDGQGALISSVSVPGADREWIPQAYESGDGIGELVITTPAPLEWDWLFLVDDLQFTPIPEPSTGLLVIAGLLGLSRQRKRSG